MPMRDDRPVMKSSRPVRRAHSAIAAVAMIIGAFGHALVVVLIFTAADLSDRDTRAPDSCMVDGRDRLLFAALANFGSAIMVSGRPASAIPRGVSRRTSPLLVAAVSTRSLVDGIFRGRRSRTSFAPIVMGVLLFGGRRGGRTAGS